MLVIRFVNNIDDNIENITKSELNKLNDYLLVDLVNNKSLDNLENLIIIEKNSSGDILYVDYNVEKSYEILRLITNSLSNSYYQLETGNKDILVNYNSNYLDYSNKNVLLNIPSGYFFKNTMMLNLGPNIPIRLVVNGSIKSSLRTDVSAYGINNAIMKLFVVINLEQSVILPNKQFNVNSTKELLLTSTIVEGQVPSFYNGLIERNTPFITNN